MKKFSRRAFVRALLLGLLSVSFIRKFLLAQGILNTVCSARFEALEASTVKAALESLGLDITGRSEHEGELNGHFFVDAINGEARLFVFTVDGYLFRGECVEHYPIYPEQKLIVYCL